MSEDVQLQQPARRKSRRRLLIVLAVAAALIGGGVGVYTHISYFYPNFHTVLAGQVYRSARPNPGRLRDWVREYHIATVLNLEGGDQADTYFVENHRTMKELGLTAVDIKLASSRLPTPEQLRQVIDVIENGRRPLLIHCRVGAERTGLGSVMAAMAAGGQNYDTARGQLSARYLHVYHGANRCEGLVDRYEEYCRSRGIGTGGWQQFREWALTVYR